MVIFQLAVAWIVMSVDFLMSRFYVSYIQSECVLGAARSDRELLSILRAL